LLKLLQIVSSGFSCLVFGIDAILARLLLKEGWDFALPSVYSSISSEVGNHAPSSKILRERFWWKARASRRTAVDYL
jgi:hypothetical protein